MSTSRQPSLADAADLFIRLYDELPDAVASDGRAGEWHEDPAVRELAARVERQLLASSEPVLDVNSAAVDIAAMPDPDAARYAYLVGLERALARAHPWFDEPSRGSIAAIAVRLRRLGRFNSSARDGALLPRYAFPSRFRAGDDSPAEVKADLFVYVTRVGREAWERVTPVRMRRDADLLPSDSSGLRFGCAPLCRADDMAIHSLSVGGRRCYDIRPRPGASVGARARGIVAALDQVGVDIGVMPELTLDDDGLAAWRLALREVPPGLGSHLRLVMVGTGPLAGHPDGTSANRAILLDRQGRDVLAQDKRHPFTLSAETVTEWGLDDHLGPGGAFEPLLPGDRLTLAETAAGRLAVLVCEDLSRNLADGPLLIAASPSLILAPVFSKPTLPHFWEHSSAKKLAAEVGCATVVANSLVVRDLQEAAGILVAGEEFGTALGHSASGSCEHGHGSEAGDLVIIRLTTDEVLTAVASAPARPVL